MFALGLNQWSCRFRLFGLVLTTALFIDLVLYVDDIRIHCSAQPLVKGLKLVSFGVGFDFLPECFDDFLELPIEFDLMFFFNFFLFDLVSCFI